MVKKARQKRGKTETSSSSSWIASSNSFQYQWIDEQQATSTKRRKTLYTVDGRGQTINAKDVSAEHDGVKIRLGKLPDTEEFSLHQGDCALFYLGKSSERAYKHDRQNEWVGQLEMLWEDHDGNPFVQLRWFYYPEETVRGRLPFQDKSEVHVTYHIDDNPLDCICGKAAVLPYEQFNLFKTDKMDAELKRNLDEVPHDNIFFCRNFYDPVLKLFRPVASSELLPRDKRMKASMRTEESAFSSSVGGASSPGLGDKQSKKSQDSELDTFRRKVDHAKSKLQLSAIPDKLPCRDNERKKIDKFLTSSIKQGGVGHSLYISGMPGTGKTAIVTEVINSLKEKSGNSLPSFHYLPVNAMKLHHPYQLYTLLYQVITNGRTTHSRAAAWLDKYFSKSHDGSPLVLLVDELDYLVTKKQTVLYNIFEWPTRPSSKLIVIGISNTMDLPERMLPKVQSRLGLERVGFQPYNSQQIDTIVRQRLEDIELFESNAVTMVSKKVSRFSGDIRRALQICNRAVDSSFDRWRKEREEGNSGVKLTIQIKDIQSAAKSLEGTQIVKAIKGLSELEKYFLSSLALQLRVDNSERAPMLRVYRRCKTLYQQEAQDQINVQDASYLVNKLIEYHLISTDYNKTDRYPSLQLNLQIDDIALALSNHPFISHRLRPDI